MDLDEDEKCLKQDAEVEHGQGNVVVEDAEVVEAEKEEGTSKRDVDVVQSDEEEGEIIG